MTPLGITKNCYAVSTALMAVVFLTVGPHWGQTILKARLETKKHHGRPGRPVIIRVKLEPSRLPSGYFIASSVELKAGPIGKPPLVETGYPEISITPFESGNYVFEITVNSIYRSSCGGAEANTLLTELVRFTIPP